MGMNTIRDLRTHKCTIPNRITGLGPAFESMNGVIVDQRNDVVKVEIVDKDYRGLHKWCHFTDLRISADRAIIK